MAPPRGPRVKPKVTARPNPIKAIQDNEWRRRQQAASVRSTPDATPPPPNPRDASKPKCPNKNCPNPNVVDGTCRTCGRVSDDSNIVAEIQFGETAGGAAVVQGSYIGPDQGGARMAGAQGGRRIAGTNTSLEAREKALREARNHIAGFAHQLNLPERTINGAFQLYKLASSRNFTQGRPSHLVAAMCLYAACRKEQTCKIMLIDLADLVKHDVFHLGRMYKAFTRDIGAGSVYHPIFVEDLVYRFAARLEFGDMTNKVAETAIRLVQRMDRDWIVMGRRPSGVCGASIIMAARMNNFRRSEREVTFIAKVTMFTLQQRLDEFAAVPSARMTVEDFLMKDFLYDQMDPPAFYKKTAEYQAKLKEKRNKRKREQADDGEQERRVDNDGFAVPPRPTLAAGSAESSGNTGDLEQDLAAAEPHLEDLVREFGPSGVAGSTPHGPSTKRPKKFPQGSSCRKKPKIEKPAYVTEEWDEDEELLEMEITEHMMNPATKEGALRLANAQELAALMLLDGGGGNTPAPTAHGKAVSSGGDAVASTDHAVRTARPQLDDPTVGEDEFADDPEVLHCLLSAEEAEAKTNLWVNQNKDWMRKQQEKEFKRRLAEANPKPARSNRSRRHPRIGEGQTSPADSATDATLEMMDRRQFSKRIDYDAVRSMLSTGGPGSTGVSRQTSHAGSVVGTPRPEENYSDEDEDEDEEEDEEEEDEEEEGEESNGQQQTKAPLPTPPASRAVVAPEPAPDEYEDDDDEVPDYGDDAASDIDPFADD